MIMIPEVGTPVQFYPGTPDQTSGFGAHAAIITAVNMSAAAWNVSLTAFMRDGSTLSRRRVIHRDAWEAAGSRPELDYWNWVGGASLLFGAT